MVGFIKKHNRLIFLAAIIACLLFIFALRSVLYPFLIGLALAYLFLPVIKWIERKLPETQKQWKTSRALVIGLTYASFFVLFIAFIVYLFSSMKPALASLTANATSFYTAAYDNIVASTDKFTDLFFNLLPDGLHQQVDLYIYNFGLNSINSIVQNFTQGNSQIGISAVGALLGLAIMPVFVFYILKDWEHIEKTIYSGIPVWAAGHTKNIVGIINGVMGRYVRAQLTLGGAVGLLSLIGFLVLRIPFAPLLALIAGFMEMVPVVGPWIGGIVAIIVTAALVPAQVGWVVLLAIGIQLTENIFLCPRIQGSFMRIHPALIMVLLVVGMFVAGVWGFILALPLAATTKEIYRYVKNKMKQPDERPEAAKESLAVEKSAIWQRESKEIVGSDGFGREQITDN